MSDRPVKPVGSLTVIGARNRSDRRSCFAVWAAVIVADEAGNQFIFDASDFAHSLKPNPEPILTQREQKISDDHDEAPVHK